MNILKYSFLLRFLSNNQVILLSSFLEAQIPINLHLSTQALVAGMKPSTEIFGQTQKPERSSYKLIFQSEVESTEISVREDLGLRKLVYSGYTQNIFVNDPFFSQTGFILATLMAFITVYLLLSILYQRRSKYQTLNSFTFKIYVFIFNQLLKVVEASFLNILVTNYILFSHAETDHQWDVSGLLMTFVFDGIIIFSTYFQVKSMNQRFLRREQIAMV